MRESPEGVHAGGNEGVRAGVHDGVHAGVHEGVYEGMRYQVRSMAYMTGLWMVVSEQRAGHMMGMMTFQEEEEAR
jgi:hypothetical protein